MLTQRNVNRANNHPIDISGRLLTELRDGLAKNDNYTYKKGSKVTGFNYSAIHQALLEKKGEKRGFYVPAIATVTNVLKGGKNRRERKTIRALVALLDEADGKTNAWIDSWIEERLNSHSPSDQESSPSVAQDPPQEPVALQPPEQEVRLQQGPGEAPSVVVYPECSLLAATDEVLSCAKSKFTLMVVTCGDVLKNCSTLFLKVLQQGVSVRIILLDPRADARIIEAFAEAIGHTPTLVNDECRHSVQWALSLMKQWHSSQNFDATTLRIYLTHLPARTRIVFSDPESKDGVAIVFPSMNKSGQIPLPAFKVTGNVANVPGAYLDSLERFIATAKPITDYLEKPLPNDDAVIVNYRDLIAAYAQASSGEK
jgi:hypothetical protein